MCHRHRRLARRRDAVNVGGFEAGIGHRVECRVGNWICEVSRMTPSRVVSAAPTMAIDFGCIALTSGPG